MRWEFSRKRGAGSNLSADGESFIQRLSVFVNLTVLIMRLFVSKKEKGGIVINEIRRDVNINTGRIRRSDCLQSIWRNWIDNCRPGSSIIE